MRDRESLLRARGLRSIGIVGAVSALALRGHLTMHLTRFTDIGLRVLMYLSMQEREPPVTVAEIARQFQLAPNHVVKVVHRLGQLGWVNTQRGRQGGVRLARAPSTFRMGDVLRELEEQQSLINCAEPPCVLLGNCSLKTALDRAMAGFFRELNTMTLADVGTRRTAQVILKLHRNALELARA